MTMNLTHRVEQPGLLQGAGQGCGLAQRTYNHVGSRMHPLSHIYSSSQDTVWRFRAIDTDLAPQGMARQVAVARCPQLSSPCNAASPGLRAVPYSSTA